jgi:sporulation protein YlmC with PRC-barrel domain
MLLQVSHFLRCTVTADGEKVGRVSDMLFDDSVWTLRHLVVRSGLWPFDRAILVDVGVIRQPDAAGSRVPLSLTRDQLKSSPTLNVHHRVQRSRDAEAYVSPVGTAMGVGAVTFMERGAKRVQTAKQENERPLRALIGFQIAANDGIVGVAHEIIIDTHGWKVESLGFTRGATSQYGQELSVLPRWIQEIDWPGRKLLVGMKSDEFAVHCGPAFLR